MSLNIVNEYGRLPFLALWHIQKSLEWISPLDLQGIDHIRLVDKISGSNVELTEELKKKYIEDCIVSGIYYKKTEAGDAFIALALEHLYFPLPNLVYCSPVPTLHIARTIAHEVAHHLVSTRGYIFLPGEKYPVYESNPEFEEEMANRYAFGVIEKMKEKRYYKMGASMMNFVSDCYYGIAAARWEARRYKSSADYWYKSFLLNSERQESIEWYWRSKEKLNASSES